MFLKRTTCSNPFLGQSLKLEVIVKVTTSLPISKTRILRGINNDSLNYRTKRMKSLFR